MKRSKNWFVNPVFIKSKIKFWIDDRTKRFIKFFSL